MESIYELKSQIATSAHANDMLMSHIQLKKKNEINNLKIKIKNSAICKWGKQHKRDKS